MIFNDKRKKWLPLLAVLILAMTAFAGCGNKDPDDAATADDEVIGDIKVTLNIDFPDNKEQTDIENKSVGMTSESSVLDLLFAYANENNLEIELDGKDSPYVKSIGGVTESDSAGWVFTVNDEVIMESAGESMLKDGDSVRWEYTDWSDMNDVG